MMETPHSAAPHHLPFFITAPGQTDVLMVVMLVVLLVVVLILGNLYFKLHALPERVAHRTSPGQMQLVAVLTLIALFTHNNFFWIAALLLAFIQFPDFLSPLNSIAQSLTKLVRGIEPAMVATESMPTLPPIASPEPPKETGLPLSAVDGRHGHLPEKGGDHA